MDDMTDGDLLNYMGDDAAKWAEQFCRIARGKGLEIDEGWMIGWFANAIEHSHALRTGCLPIVLSDGSAFFVA